MTAGQVTTMQALVRERYGTPDDLELREAAMPELTSDAALVRVRATSINRGDWYGLAGLPYVARPTMGLLKPRSPLLGGDFAGAVEAVGEDVSDLEPGDEVFGGRSGAFAEYVSVRTGVAPKPANVTFEEAAAVPVAALTALQGLRDHGRLEAGQRVLVNGASGGVGTFAVQIAKALGAEVTAVCSTRNGKRYDLMLDVAGSRSWSQCRRVLAPRATLVMVGAPKGNRLLGPLGHVIKVRLASLRGSQKAAFFIAKFNRPDLHVLRELVESAKVKPVVERRYELSEIGDGLRYIGEGHVQGKLVVTI